MKKLIYIFVLIGLLGSSRISFAQQAAPLTTLDFSIVGVGLGVSPEYQAVPKGIASRVDTAWTSGGTALPVEIVQQLPSGFVVKAELTGPAYQTPLQLATLPGQPFDLPTLPLLGKYTLSNIRVYDSTGTVLFGASPQAVTVESIKDPLITSVTTRLLTLEEIRDRGVTIDSTNYTAYEFTAALATVSGTVPFTFPVLIPLGTTEPVVEHPIDIGIPNLPEEGLMRMPPGTTFIGFGLVCDGPCADIKETGTPPGGAGAVIPGIIVIPGNIGFLHQYFSAMVIVTNGTPGVSGLVVRDLQAKIILPAGADATPDTDDDPLRMAMVNSVEMPKILPIMHPGPDGKYGTSDDISRLYPAESGQADFTVEGVKEGTHKLDFEITAVLEGLPTGPVNLKGRATGAVLVRNPDFTVTLGHPDTVRDGEPYDLFVTITNTSLSAANLLSLRLDPKALSGAIFAPDEEPDKQIETIPPGSAETVRYRLISQRTGRVTATAFASEDVKSRFILRMGVGELGIPLSPDTLIIPHTGGLPDDLVYAAVGLLGQAWSVATAPTGALPADVLPIGKSVITARVNDLSEAGLRISMGEAVVRSVEDLAFDYLGSDEANRPFDDLRRRTNRGSALNTALASVFRNGVESSDLFTFQADFALQNSYRPGHISVITSEAPVSLKITDAAGNRIGGLAAGETFRGIPYSDQFILSATEGPRLDPSGAGSEITERSTLSLITIIQSASYQIDITAEAPGLLDLGIVLPDASGALRQVRFANVPVVTGSKGRIVLLPGTNTDYALVFDDNDDGTADRTVEPSQIYVLPDPGPQVVAAAQISDMSLGDDGFGRRVAVLFSERVTKETAENTAHYAVEGNRVMKALLQRGGRMAFFALQEGIGPYIPRSLTVTGIRDTNGNPMDTPAATVPILITTTAQGAIVSGTLRTANGEPVFPSRVRVWVMPKNGEDPYLIAETPTENGYYHFDFIARTGHPPLEDFYAGFTLEGINETTNEITRIGVMVGYGGQQITADLFFSGKGTVTGTVRDTAGNPVPNADVGLSTLNDGWSYAVKTDAMGVFVFTNVTVGAFSLKAVSETLFAEGRTMGTLSEAGQTATVDITIYRPEQVKKGTVTGKVYEPDGVTPREGAVVVVSSGAYYYNWTRTDAEGNYIFTGVFEGLVQAWVREEGTATIYPVKGYLYEGQTLVLNILLRGHGTVTGTVVREDGKSPEGLHVWIQGVGMVPAAADGSFRFENVPVGDVYVWIPAQEVYQGTYKEILAEGRVTLLADGDTVSITLRIPDSAFATGSIKGTVYRRDGSILPLAEVRRIISAEDGTYEAYRADSQGRYVIPDLKLGTYTLVVGSGMNIANGTAVLWYGGQEKTVDLRMVGVGAVTGTIYDGGSGEPTGADVLLFATKPDRNGILKYETDKPAAMLKSDPQTGRYTFTGVFAGEFIVKAYNVFRPVPAMKKGEFRQDGEIVTADLTLTDVFGSISGKVLLPDGVTPAGPDVEVTVIVGNPPAPVQVRTDEAGEFQFRPVIPAGQYDVIAEDPVTTLKGKVGVKLPPRQDVPVTIRLLGRGAMTVRAVYDEEGSTPPAAGAKVTVEGIDFPKDSAEGTANEDGAVTFSNLSEGTYAVTAVGTYGRGGRARADIPADNAQVEVEVKLAPSGTVRGRFLKPDGITPVAGGQILVRYVDKELIAYTASSLDPATPGEFVFEYMPLGDFKLEGYDPISMRWGLGGGRMTEKGQTVTADIIVIPQGMIRGTVLNNAGTAPVGNASVTLRAEGVFRTALLNMTSTAPDGSFTFAGVPAGKFTLEAEDFLTKRKGSVSGSLTTEGETARAEIRLQPTGTIEGRVLMPDGVTPTMNADVFYTGPLGSSLKIRTDGQGNFRFLNVIAGETYMVSAEEAGTFRVGKATTTLMEDGGTATVDITLNGIGTVQGTVYYYDDSNVRKPLYDAEVMLRVISSLYDLQHQYYAYYTAYTDINGNFRFANKAPVGTITLWAKHPDKTTGASDSGNITSEGEIVTMDLVLGPVGSITGTVLLADGVTPARGGGVRYTCGYKTFIAIIDTNGVFLFENIPLCEKFTLYMEDATGLGIGYSGGSLTENGQVVDVGTIVLDDKAIAVADVTPASGTVNVPVNTAVTVTFSEPADPETLTTANIYLLKGNTRVSGTLSISADNTSVTFTPSQPLAGFTLYTVAVNGGVYGVKDRVGRTLPQTFTSAFTTIDITPPTVKSVYPLNGAIEVTLDGTIRITFSESVDPASFSGIGLSVNNAPAAIQTDLTQANTLAILTPLGGMLPNSTYTITISGVKDTVGNVMVGAFTSSFATVDTIAPQVTGLTYPANADLIKGNTIPVTAFVDSTDVAFVDFFVDNVLVATDTTAPYTQNITLTKEGTIYLKAVAQDNVGNRGLSYPQPAMALNIAPDQAPSVAITSPAAGNSVIAGSTFTVSVQASDDLSLREISLAASGEVVFSQTKTGLTGKSASTTFTLTAPANAIPGNAIQLTATVKDSGGNAGQTTATLTVAADQPPTVTITSPAEGSTVNTGSTLTVSVQATDDLNVREVTLATTGELISTQTRTGLSDTSYSTSFTLSVPLGAVPGNAIQLTATAKDSAGNTNQAVRAVYIRDNITPTVVLTSPGQTAPYRPGETGTATVTASDNIGITTISCSASDAATGSQTFTISPAQTQVTQTFNFQVIANAAPYAQITISCIARDAVGNQSSSASNLVLTVADVVPPSVVSASIQNNSTTVPVDAPISVLFNETLAPSSVSTSSVGLVVDDGTNQGVSGSVALSADRKTITFTPTGTMVKGAPYRFTIGRTVTDDAGNAMGSDYVLRFTTSYGVVVIQNQGTASSPYMLSPGGYTDISITNSTVMTAGGITVSTLEMTNSMLITKETVTAERISLTTNSVLTHDSTTITDAGRLDVTAATMSIDSTSKIDVTGKGYLGSYQGGNSGSIGMTHDAVTSGPTITGGSTSYNGGSYGGLGGIYSSGSVNAVYGDLMNPAEVGSGGGGASGYKGGNGGGLVRITAGTLSLAGSILADGTGVTYGAGSGGGIRIDVGTLSGTGAISAKGGTSSYGGAGGGGRIAIYYTDRTDFTGTVTANGGKSGTGATASMNGGAGTVFMKDNAKPNGDLIIDNQGTDTADISTPLRSVNRGVITGLTADSLTNANATWTAGALKGLKFNPDITQTNIFTIVNNDVYTLYTDSSEGDLTQAAAVGSAYTGVYSLNQLSIAGKARVACSDRLVVADEVIVRDASLFSDNNDITADKITIKNGGLITHLKTTTTTTYKVELNATTSLIIEDSTSRIDVTGLGYLGSYQGGNSGPIGMTHDAVTSGPTTTGGSTSYNGGSYGGLGGIYSSGSVNGVYGDLMNPAEVGSGGGGASGNKGGNGGGLVRITAGTLSLAGSILADGAGAAYGAGSGGGIRIDVGTLFGTGTISAKGGASTSGGGAGGGGRIAIYYDTRELPTANITAVGGISGNGSTASRNGGAGTVYLHLR